MDKTSSKGYASRKHRAVRPITIGGTQIDRQHRGAARELLSPTEVRRAEDIACRKTRAEGDRLMMQLEPLPEYKWELP
jgi:hypothetical protein